MPLWPTPIPSTERPGASRSTDAIEAAATAGWRVTRLVDADGDPRAARVRGQRVSSPPTDPSRCPACRRRRPCRSRGRRLPRPWPARVRRHTARRRNRPPRQVVSAVRALDQGWRSRERIELRCIDPRREHLVGLERADRRDRLVGVVHVLPLLDDSLAGAKRSAIAAREGREGAAPPPDGMRTRVHMLTTKSTSATGLPETTERDQHA